MMDLSVVIVSYNTCEVTRDCLLSIFQKTEGLEFEVVVVDNASTDGSVEMIRREFPQVRLLDETTNWGFGRANNIGAEASAGEYLLLLNSDTLLVGNPLKELVDFARRHPDLGIAGGQLLDANQQRTPSYCPFPTLWSEFVNALLPAKLHGKAPVFSDEAMTIDQYIWGTDMLIPKRVFDQVGGFDRDYFMYFEDVDLSRRIRHAGFRLYSVPQAQIIHFGGQSGDSLSASSSTYMDKWSYKETQYSRYLYLHKWYGSCGARLVCTTATIKGRCAATVFGWKQKSGKQDYWQRYESIIRVQYKRYVDWKSKLKKR